MAILNMLKLKKIVLHLVGIVGCLILSIYFALMAFVNIYGRDPSEATASFAIVLCGLALWGAIKLIISVGKTIHSRKSNLKEFEFGGDNS